MTSIIAINLHWLPFYDGNTEGVMGGALMAAQGFVSLKFVEEDWLRDIGKWELIIGMGICAVSIVSYLIG